MAIRWRDVPPPADDLVVVAGREGRVDVHVEPQADAQVRAHLASAPVELGGLLVGCAYRDAVGAITQVRIVRAVPADASTGTAVSLRMDASVWSAAQRATAGHERIVGWYHSHPGLTAFFSRTDRDTQRAFFAHPYSVGWVVDPWLGEEAFFLGADCLPVERGPSVLAEGAGPDAEPAMD